MLPASHEHQMMSLKSIDDIPLDKRKNICTFIDFSLSEHHGYWERLVTELGFDENDSKNFQLAFAKNQSPTQNLLRECSYRNYRIVTLITVLKRIGLTKLAEDNLENIGEKYNRSPLSPNIPVFYGAHALGNVDKPRCPIESDSSSSSHSGSDDKIGGLDTIHYPYEEIRKGTNDFARDMKLGAGAFGKVYKVNLKNTVFACKVLTINTDNTHFSIVSKHKEHNDLRNELRYLAEYRHPNIIPLYGWSLDGKDPCLIYQYMKNGSLQDCLQRLKGNLSLNWLSRVKISCDAARGLQFLHGAKSKPLIHGDIKTANILLDDSFSAKLGDFGLAREGPRSHVTGSYINLGDGHTPGTIGYLAPEYMQSKKLSVQVDTYAFGVVLLELYTGRRAYDRSQKKAGVLLRDYVDDVANGLMQGGTDEAEDRLFEHQSPEIDKLPKDIAIKFVKFALECCHEKRIKRPSMRIALERLEAICDDIEKSFDSAAFRGTQPQLDRVKSVDNDFKKQNLQSTKNQGVRYETHMSRREPVESVDHSLVQSRIDSSLPHKNSDLYMPPGENTFNEALKQLNLNEEKSNSCMPSTKKQGGLYQGYPMPPQISIPPQYTPGNSIYPPPGISSINQPHPYLQWMPSGASAASPVFPMWHQGVPHQAGLNPYLFSPGPGYPVDPSQYHHPSYLNMPKQYSPNDVFESSDAKLSSNNPITPVSPITPGLSTPEPFSSLEYDVPGNYISGHSPQPSNPFLGKMNGFHHPSNNTQSVNQPYLHPLGVHLGTPQPLDRFQSVEHSGPQRAQSVPDKSETLSQNRSYRMKVNGPKAELLDRLSEIGDTNDNLTLSQYFRSSPK